MIMNKKTVRSSPKRLVISAPLKEKHEKDFYQWTRDQMFFLKNKEFGKLDTRYLIEEMESLGNSEKNAIESHLIILFLHLLKIAYQPAMRCNSWNNSVENAKFRITRLVEKNPSLKTKVSEFFPDAYFSARLQASSETGLNASDFPEVCPWAPQELFPFLKKRQVRRR